MRRLVADLLLLARADAGRVAPHVPVDLADVVTEAAGELEPVAGDHQISVDAPPRRGARGRARRAAPAHAQPAGERAAPHRPGHGGRGHACERINGEVVLAVEDDGPGIPPELHDKVFERFFRGAGRPQRLERASGSSIVRAVAQLARRHR